MNQKEWRLGCDGEQKASLKQGTWDGQESLDVVTEAG